MGIPAFFRWLTQKYPKLTSQAQEDYEVVDGQELPIDFSKPNPNGTEFNNLYLDMNGIIHPCTHPEDKPAPKNENEMYIEIFRYIDRIFNIIRPRSLVYMAIDGVAPRAKMNQQRSRRFRAAQEAQILADEQDKIRQDLMERNLLTDTEEKKEHFDSNCITPGTPFMHRLAIALRYYIADRLNSHPGWENVKVILSDANVPGEGEHKIMDFIRRERNHKQYNPNTRHVLYGLDADLIMLALATHEPHFDILREDVNFKDAGNKGCFICGEEGHQASNCKGKPMEKSSKQVLQKKPYILLHVNILREYLEMELAFNDPALQWDLERAIDDWVMLCFFVGNDFLPHLPSLEIREGAVDKLVELWKKHIIIQHGYLTNSGEIDLIKVKNILHDLGEAEDEIFRERKRGEERRREGRRRRRDEKKRQDEEKLKPKVHPSQVWEMVPSYPLKMSAEERHLTSLEAVKQKQAGLAWTPDQVRMKGSPSGDEANKKAAADLKEIMMAKKVSAVEANKKAAASLKEMLANKAAVAIVGEKRPIDQVEGDVDEAVIAEDDVVEDEDVEEEIEEESGEVDPMLALNKPLVALPVIQKQKPKADIKENDSEEEPDDSVRFWESGWKKRYYEDKFQTDVDNEDFKRDIVTKYVEGFCWVLKYYYQGVQSWTWYFPYHYSPFASDFHFIDELDIKFIEGKPFNPFEQLMGVLPTASRQHVPAAFQPLMLLQESPIIDFYPEKFPIDLNGKKFAWQGVALLPFIDEDRLVEAMSPYYEDLSPDQKAQNERGHELIWMASQNGDYEAVCAIYGKRDLECAILPSMKGDVHGECSKDVDVCLPGSTFYSPLPGLPDVTDNNSISLVYFMPKYENGFQFPAKLVMNVEHPRKVLDAADYQFVKSGGGSNRGGRGRGRGGRGRGRGNEVADRFIRHGIGHDNRRDQNSGNGYDNRRNNNDDQNKRSRYDDRQQGYNNNQHEYNGQQRYNQPRGGHQQQQHQRGYQQGGYQQQQQQYQQPYQQTYQQQQQYHQSYQAQNQQYQQAPSQYYQQPQQYPPHHQYQQSPYQQQQQAPVVGQSYYQQPLPLPPPPPPSGGRGARGGRGHSGGYIPRGRYQGHP